MKARTLFLVVALGLPGCYTTTVSSGKAAAPARVDYDEKWHHGAVWGIAELSGPHDLKGICPHGWAEITTETSFLNGFVDAVTYGVYNPQSVTVRCALPAKTAAKPAQHAQLPAPVAAPEPAAPPAPAIAPAPAALPAAAPTDVSSPVR